MVAMTGVLKCMHVYSRVIVGERESEREQVSKINTHARTTHAPTHTHTHTHQILEPDQMCIGYLRSSLCVLYLPTCHQSDTSNNGRNPGYGSGRRVIPLLNHLEEYAKRSDTASDDEEIGDDTAYNQTNRPRYSNHMRLKRDGGTT